MSLLSKKIQTSEAKIIEPGKNLLTADSPFAVQEAYKTLRTNVIFSIPGEHCKKIVITSATQGESKSTTAVNLSIAFAQNHSKILLVDCDLRLPSVAFMLGIKQTPGLSNILVGMSDLSKCIRHFSNGMDVLPAGDIPPNPTELLGSDNMNQLMQELEKQYDYIILDTPPVCTVVDAAILSKITSGVLISVRQNIADRNAVNEALQKLEFAQAKILGFVFTGVENEKRKSYRKNKHYGYGYDYGYAHSYSAAAAQNASSQMKKTEEQHEDH